MPLSEHEQRMLDQIERALYAEDPKFANTVRETNPAVHYKRWIIKHRSGSPWVSPCSWAASSPSSRRSAP